MGYLTSFYISFYFFLLYWLGFYGIVIYQLKLGVYYEAAELDYI